MPSRKPVRVIMLEFCKASFTLRCGQPSWIVNDRLRELHLRAGELIRHKPNITDHFDRSFCFRFDSRTADLGRSQPGSWKVFTLLVAPIRRDVTIIVKVVWLVLKTTFQEFVAFSDFLVFTARSTSPRGRRWCRVWVWLWLPLSVVYNVFAKVYEKGAKDRRW